MPKHYHVEEHGMTFFPLGLFSGVSCVGDKGEPANMTECLQWAGPLQSQIRECRVACKDDCTLTPWSKFSDCAGCGSSQTRRRSLLGKDSDCLVRRRDTNITRDTCFIFFCYWNNGIIL